MRKLIYSTVSPSRFSLAHENWAFLTWKNLTGPQTKSTHLFCATQIKRPMCFTAMQQSLWSWSGMVKDTSAEWLHPEMDAGCLKQLTSWWTNNISAYYSRGRASDFVLLSLYFVRERSHSCVLQLFSRLNRLWHAKKHKQIQIMFERADQWWNKQLAALWTCLFSLCILCCFNIKLP